MLNEFLYEINKGFRTKVASSPFFIAMREAALTREQFRLFASQRVPLGRGFEELLITAIDLSNSLGYEKLNLALKRNLADENGDLTGDPHSAWKEDYLSALGVDPRGPTKVLKNTSKITDFYRSSCGNGDLYEIYGILCSLEFSIPKEYRAAIVSRDKLFSETFVVMDSDNEKLKKYKRRARLYMDDHVAHDEKIHFKELRDSFDECVNDIEELESCIRGVVNTFECRSIFYSSLMNVSVEDCNNYV